MSLLKLQDYILESWLPTKLSILIAGSSISLAALAIGLPEFLQKIVGHPLQPEKTMLLRIVVPLTILLIGTFSVLLLVIRHFKAIPKKSDETEPGKNNQTQEEVMLKQIILHILKLRGANEPATPKRIAGLMGQDTGIVFAHMWKLHNDQYMTFQTGGAMPTVDTDFFLSPKAYDIVKLERA